jgi:hypothetical protein
MVGMVVPVLHEASPLESCGLIASLG